MDKLEDYAPARKDRKLKRYSATYVERKMKLLGHVVRADNKDPMRQVTFEKGNVTERTVGKRRVGKPKLKWTKTTMQEAWNKKSIEN